MPEISRFLGIVVAMYYRDHAPPHFHARYGEREVRIEIATGVVLTGTFPPHAKRLVLEWLAMHRAELAQDWHLAEQRKPMNPIAPLE